MQVENVTRNEEQIKKKVAKIEAESSVHLFVAAI